MSNFFTEKDLQILIATKDRVSLDFLLAMFPFELFSNFNILIVNQSKKNILESEFPSVRVINSKDVGLSKSRNLAINNASKRICLFADDDVTYTKDFDKMIVKAFNSNIKASIITFNHQRIGLNYPHKKDNLAYLHNKKTIEKVCSVEIGFKLDDIKKNNIYFDEYFGLGTYFETADEFLFLRSCLKANQKLYYHPEVILFHPPNSSGEFQGDDRVIYARAALKYKIHNVFAYLWLLKYLFFIYRHKFINSSEFGQKFRVGLSGIDKYKELEKVKNK